MDRKRFLDAINDDVDRQRDERRVKPKECWIISTLVLRKFDSVVATQVFEECSVLDRARYLGLSPTVKTWWKLCKITQIDELRSAKHPPLYRRPQYQGNLRNLIDHNESVPVWVAVQTVVESAAQAPVRGDTLGSGVREGCAQHLFLEAFATALAAYVFPVPPWPKRSTLCPLSTSSCSWLSA